MKDVLSKLRLKMIFLVCALKIHGLKSLNHLKLHMKELKFTTNWKKSIWNQKTTGIDMFEKKIRK